MESLLSFAYKGCGNKQYWNRVLTELIQTSKKAGTIVLLLYNEDIAQFESNAQQVLSAIGIPHSPSKRPLLSLCHCQANQWVQRLEKSCVQVCNSWGWKSTSRRRVPANNIRSKEINRAPFGSLPHKIVNRKGKMSDAAKIIFSLH